VSQRLPAQRSAAQSAGDAWPAPRAGNEPSQARLGSVRLGHLASSVMRLGSARYRLASRLGSAREPVHSSTQQH
jgi:hypothetical protein